MATSLVRRLTIPVSLVLLCSCNVPKGDQGPIGPSGKDALSDKQIRLDLPQVSFSTTDTAGTLPPANSVLVAFNTSNYVSVDSLVFAACLATNDTSAACQATLYDATNKRIIDSSVVSTTSTSPTWCFSKNSFAGLPAGTINVSVMLRSSKQGASVSFYSGVLLLYRE